MKITKAKQLDYLNRYMSNSNHSTETRRDKFIIVEIPRQEGFWLLLRRFLNFLTVIMHQLRWRWRFHRFGWRSRLAHPDMLTYSKAISIGRKVNIRKGARLEVVGGWDGQRPKITIGDGCGIQFYFHCGAAESVTIGKDVGIGARVLITDHDHMFDTPGQSAITALKLRCAPVVVEDGVTLHEGCAILKGVRVGKRAVVGANAVVTKDVPPYTIVGGIPARVIRKIETANTDVRC